MSTNELHLQAAPAPVPSVKGDAIRRHIPDLLVVILDCSIFGWASVARARVAAADASGISSPPEVTPNQEMEDGAAQALETTLADVLVFLNAHVAMQSDNAVAVYGSVGSEARLLYSTAGAGAEAPGGGDSESNSTSPGDSSQRERARPDANTFQDFKTLDSQVYFGVRRLIRRAVQIHSEPQHPAHERESGRDDDAPRSLQHTGLVPALSQALCLTHRLGASDPTGTGAGAGKVGAAAASGAGGSATVPGAFRPRILVLSVTGDTSSQYVAMMNCVFAAQKSGVPISMLKLHGPDSVFMQQAAYLTGGIYLRVDLAQSAAGNACLASPEDDTMDVERRSKRRKTGPQSNGTGGLIQVLLSAFLPLPGGTSSSSSGLLGRLSGLADSRDGSSGSSAALLHTPVSDAVDFRAACFCHHKTVSVGYVCSVCLSIFCHPKRRCDTCRSVFPPSTVDRLARQRQLLVDAGLAKDIPVD